MHRRAFVVAGVAGGVIIARSVAGAQPAGKVYRVGILLVAAAESVAPLVRALTDGLRDLGYVEGRNVVFERRYADGALGRLPDIASELVRLRMDVIVTGSNVHLAALQNPTRSIPIVFVAAGDPV